MTYQKILKKLSLVASATVLLAAFTPAANAQSTLESQLTFESLLPFVTFDFECRVTLPETTRDIVADLDAAPGNLGLFARHENVNDNIVGGDGGENIFGGIGSDALTGNGGGDFFHFDGAYMNDGDHDFITDFELLKDRLTTDGSVELVGYGSDCDANLVLRLASTWAPNPVEMKVTLLDVTLIEIIDAAYALDIDVSDGSFGLERFKIVLNGFEPLGD